MQNRCVIKPFSPALLLSVAMLATVGPLAMGDVASVWFAGNGNFGQTVATSNIVDWSATETDDSHKTSLFETMGRVARQFQSLHGQMFSLLAGEHRRTPLYPSGLAAQAWSATLLALPPQPPLRENMLNLPPPFFS